MQDPTPQRAHRRAIRLLDDAPTVESVASRDPRRGREGRGVAIRRGTARREFNQADVDNGAAAFEQARHGRVWGGRTRNAGGRLLDGRTWDELPSRSARLG